MLEGEYESAKVVYSVMPDFIPEPHGFGRYKVQNPPTYFYLSQFVYMDVEVHPDPTEFTSRLAELHQKSRSPTGKYGFHVVTCDGDRAHVVDWEASWAVFFRKLFLRVCELDTKTNGPWPEYERAVRQIAWTVIPVLLGPLEDQIKPCVIHGDLWEGNMGIDSATSEPVLFDVGSYYAHNEMELGHWRCEFSSVFRCPLYIEKYQNSYPPAEPADQFDDRNRLYSLKGAINYSAGHQGSPLRMSYV